MTPEALPPDLLALKRELASRALPEPPAELRSRVLMLVGLEWPSPRPSLSRDRFVRFVAAVAAAALLAINLSASVANDTDWFAAAPTDRADVAAIAAHLRRWTRTFPTTMRRDKHSFCTPRPA